MSKKLIAPRTLKAKPHAKTILPNGLNLKRNTFVEQYLIDKNGKQAAIRAGYAPRSAEVTASQLLSDPKVKAELDRRVAEMSKQSGIDAQWLLDRLAEEAKADVDDLYDNEGNFKPIKEWPLIWRQGLVAGIEMGEVTIDGQTVRRPVKLKLSERGKRLELIGRHVGVQAFRDNTRFEVPPGTAQEIGKGIVEGMSAKEAAMKYKEKLG